MGSQTHTPELPLILGINKIYISYPKGNDISKITASFKEKLGHPLKYQSEDISEEQ
jgi:hypothetical protein